MPVKRNEKGQLMKGSDSPNRGLAARTFALRAALNNLDFSVEEEAQMLQDIAMGKASIKMLKSQKSQKKRGGKDLAQDPDSYSDKSQEIEIAPTYIERIAALSLKWGYQFGKPNQTVTVENDTEVTHTINLQALSSDEIRLMLELQKKTEAVDGEVLSLPKGEESAKPSDT